jgi:hypothetical protein
MEAASMTRDEHKLRGGGGLVEVVLAPTRWDPARRQRALAEAGMHVLFFLVGLAPWLLVNALFMQVPPPSSPSLSANGTCSGRAPLLVVCVCAN